MGVTFSDLGRMEEEKKAKAASAKKQAAADKKQQTTDDAKTAQAVALGGKLAANSLGSLMVGIETGKAIKAKGKEAVSAMEAIGLANMVQMKDARQNVGIINENLTEMLSETENQARMAKGRIIVPQSESNLAGTSMNEAQAIVDVNSSKDKAVLKRKTKEARLAVVRKAIGLQKQSLEDIKSIKDNMITEREAIANGVMNGVKDLATNVGSVSAAYGA